AGGDGNIARTMAVESLGDAAYLYAESAVAPDGLIARIPPLDTHRAGEMLRVGAQPEHCHLFDADGRAVGRKPSGGWGLDATAKAHMLVRDVT
ncbi:TOBE domain-containing protein, partial [Burkholderia ubonensis]|uniref:TOBE domain-containing protein n=1 Tax=Burkholderia ubonensis TaxID=101571 RepID=UPI000AEC5AE4